jgi:hypothetical protein
MRSLGPQGAVEPLEKKARYSYRIARMWVNLFRSYYDKPEVWDEQLIVVRLVKKVAARCGNRRSSTIFKTNNPALDRNPYQNNPVQFSNL